MESHKSEGSCDSTVGLSGTFLQQRLYYPKVGSVDTLLEYLTGFGEDVHLTLLFVHIDATLFPSSPPVCGTDRVDPVWSLCYHVRMTSRFIASIR